MLLPTPADLNWHGQLIDHVGGRFNPSGDINFDTCEPLDQRTNLAVSVSDHEGYPGTRLGTANMCEDGRHGCRKPAHAREPAGEGSDETGSLPY